MDNCFSLKSKKKELQSQGVYHSDDKMAKIICEAIPKNVKEVYDPTCGVGGLLKYFNDDVKKYGEEINAEMCAIAATIPNSNIINTDTLKAPKFLDKRFDAIVANYPFSIKWEPKDDERFKGLPCLPPSNYADFAFIFHILYLLKDDGIASVLCFNGILYRKNKEQKLREYLINNNLIDTIKSIKAKSFEDTNIPTTLIVFKKNREAGAPITFINEDGDKKDVPIADIINNNFSLSVSNYCPKEEVKEEVNPFELERQVREHLKNHLKQALGLSNWIIALNFHDNKDVFNKDCFNQYLDSLKDCIDMFYIS
ncbi:MAG: HsdM family class I SAM-dependent methyltransferase [Treponema sp.]